MVLADTFGWVPLLIWVVVFKGVFITLGIVALHGKYLEAGFSNGNEEGGQIEVGNDLRESHSQTVHVVPGAVDFSNGKPVGDRVTDESFLFRQVFIFNGFNSHH